MSEQKSGERGQARTRPRQRPCPACYGGRIVIRERPTEPRHEVTCPQCGGSGFADQFGSSEQGGSHE